MAVLKAALLGLGRGGRQVADILLRSSWCELVCAASRKPERLQKFAAQHPDIQTVNDYRLAVVSRPLDVLFVAMPPFQRMDYLRIAADRGIPVWMLSPPLHRLDQLVEAVELFERSGVPIAAARMWGGESALRPRSAGLDELGPLFLAEGRVRTCWSGELQWRGDAALAGGGVLLDQGYLMLDAIVQLLGTPATVQAFTARTPPPGAPAVYDTEDTACVMGRYADGAIALLSATRRGGPEEWSLHLTGREGSMLITDGQIIVRDRAGDRERIYHNRIPTALSEQVEEYLSLIKTSPRRIAHGLREHLAAMTVIQAAYLSARTGHPETPAAISDMHQMR